MRITLRAASIALSASMLAVSCTSAAPGAPAIASPTAPKILTISQDTEPLTLDPHGDSTKFTTNITRQVFSTLVRLDEKLQLQPDLATSWRNVDPTTWEFKLRDGVTFHDGSKFSSDDVKFSFDRILDSANKLQVRTFVATIARAEVVDSLTVRLVTNGPDPVLLRRISFVGFIIPAKTFQTMGVDAFAAHPVGSGPFKFVEWVKNERIVYEANKGYWAGPPKIDRLIWKSITETSTRMAALKTGQVDIANHLPIQEVSGVNGDAKLRVSSTQSTVVNYFIFDTVHAPLDNVDVRRAINYAVDSASILKNLFGGQGSRVLLGSSAIFGIDPTIQPYFFDPVKAKELLTKAGYPSGLDVPLNTSTAGMTADDKSTVQAVVAQLANVGIRAQVSTSDFGTIITKWRARELRGMTLFSYGFSTPDLDALMGTHFDSKRAVDAYKNSALDDLIQQARTSFDNQQRLDLYKQVQTLIKDDAPWLFLYNLDNVFGVNKRVKGWDATPNEWIWVYPIDVG